MPFYELACMDCEVLFELGLPKQIDTSLLWCLDCGSTNLKLMNYDEEFSNRIAQLVLDVQELTERLENLEWYLSDDDQSDTTTSKKNNSIKN